MEFNFFDTLNQFSTVYKVIVKYYPMAKKIIQVLDQYIDNPLLEKILHYISEAEKLGLSGEEKKKFVVNNVKLPEEKTEVIDKIVGIINSFKR
jgi:hypothetical protein